VATLERETENGKFAEMVLYVPLTIDAVNVALAERVR
jgi:hypothetical protein